ncbi:MAG: FAD-dependent oxidoreductase [Magnetospirillum sp. WYHS-4]
MKIGILGGGLTGLVAAAHLDHPCEVLEADGSIGGHCRSLIEDGYTFDLGGPHILFSRDPAILAGMLAELGDNVHQGRRANKVFFKGRYVKYPFENGLHDLEPEDRFECLKGYLFNDHPPPANFREWLLATFGTGIAEKYLIPYNEKIWNLPAAALGFEWCEGRIPKPPADDVIKAAVGVETEGYVHQLHFQYPRSGGIEALPRAYAARARGPLLTGFRASKVRREGDGWAVSDGGEFRHYDRLLSTIAMQDLLAALPGVPASVAAAAAALRFNSLIVVMLGVRDTPSLPYTAVYVPDPQYLSHRLSFPLSFTPEGAPPGHLAVAAEITTNPGDGVHELDDETVTARVIADLAAMGILEPEKVVFRRIHRTRYAYTVPVAGTDANRKTVLDFIESQGIVSAGRNAEFRYINMDEAVRSGRQAAERLNAVTAP